MSRQAELKARIHSLSEIKSILSAMKNLAVIETGKVSRYLGAQNELMADVEETLDDFEQFFKAEAAAPPGAPALYVLIGSERGFCGGFNDTLAARFAEVSAAEAGPTRILAVGRKLASRLKGDIVAIAGASAAEEIALSITELTRKLAASPWSEWTLVHHEGEAGRSPAVVRPFGSRPPRRRPGAADPPLLYLPPAQLYPALREQYLFAVLYRAFYLSFLAENRERLRHMEAALGAIDRNWSKLRREANTLRQEEITEELEIIMLSVGD